MGYLVHQAEDISFAVTPASGNDLSFFDLLASMCDVGKELSQDTT